MENQQPTGEAKNSQKKEWYKNWWGVIIAIMILPIFAIWYIWTKTKWSKTIKWVATAIVIIIFIGVVGSNNNSNTNQTTSQSPQSSPAPTEETKSDNNNQPAQTADNQAQNITPQVQNNTPVQPTNQPSLEKYLTSIISSASSDMSLKNMKVDKSDPDRPKGTQMITVNVDVKNFSKNSDKNSFLVNTGKLTSTIFQAVYSIQSLKAYDVIVYYSTGTADAPIDRYGNVVDGGLSYYIDQPTYGKINWQNFNQTNLCTFLQQENERTHLGDTGCLMMGNVQ